MGAVATDRLSMATFLVDFLFGGFASVVSKTISCPIENIKLLQQNQNALLLSGVIDRPYNGMFDCAWRTISSDGITALWAGNFISIIRYFPTQMLNFAVKDAFRTLVPAKSSGYYPWLMGNMLSGTAAGSISLLLVYPLDYARTLLACDLANGGVRQFSGVLDVCKKTISSGGIFALYRGFGISVLGIAVYRGVYFLLYDSVFQYIPAEYRKNPLAKFFISVGVVMAAGLITYPIDTIRRRMMVAPADQIVFHSAYSCAHYIIRNEGFLALFDGAIANCLRGLAGSAVLVFYDNFVTAFRNRNKSNE